MTKQLLRLGVNIDHVATVRQARGTSYPDPLDAARICESAGAGGITVHLREDRRHIQDRDVFVLKDRLTVPLNLEMAAVPEIVRIACKVKPDEVCLVPEKRRELTTEGGLEVAGRLSAMRRTVGVLQDTGIEVSLFIAPDRRQLEAATAVGASVVELHTGAYCDARGASARRELNKLIHGAHIAHDLGLKVNAGHGINLDNIDGILRIPWMDTLNIGHSIVARAVLVGLKNAVREMLKSMSAYRGGVRA